MLAHPKKVIKTLIDLCGFEIHRKTSPPQQPPRTSMYQCLQQAVKNGLTIETVLDVGAAEGTPALYDVFPDAHHILIEPLEEFAPALKHLAARLKHADYLPAAAMGCAGHIMLNVHPDLVGSSVYKEPEDSGVNGVERTVPAVTLDEVCQQQDAKPPYLIKIDAQGGELDVLRGAARILPETTFVILEVSLFEFFKGGPQVWDCMNFMKTQGFVLYDIFDLQYRLFDGAMSQMDMAFVQENGLLRKVHVYATKEQREEQNRRFAEMMFGQASRIK